MRTEKIDWQDSHPKDPHGPQYGCNYNSCGNPTAGKCPFVRDEQPAPRPPSCKHEYRQVTSSSALVGKPQFYCIHCLTITTP